MIALTTFVGAAVAQNIFFYLIAAVMVIAALRVVTTDNIVHAALYLVVVLAGVAAQFILLGAEFVGVTQVLVYIGAVIVLFLFGIMLTRAPLGVSEDLNNNQRYVGIAAGGLLLVVVGYALIESFGADKLDFRAYENLAEANTNGRTQALADTIFGQYLIPFEMISVLLLAALIGAIVLARRD
jgi:NADH-quinone oxidoreductase subunit J